MGNPMETSSLPEIKTQENGRFNFWPKYLSWTTSINLATTLFNYEISSPGEYKMSMKSSSYM